MQDMNGISIGGAGYVPFGGQGQAGAVLAQQQRQPTPMESAMKEVQSADDQVGVLVEALRGRLACVLRPDSPISNPAIGQAVPARESYSPLVDEMLGLARVRREQRAMLKALLDRLTV